MKDLIEGTLLLVLLAKSGCASFWRGLAGTTRNIDPECRLDIFVEMIQASLSYEIILNAGREAQSLPVEVSSMGFLSDAIYSQAR